MNKFILIRWLTVIIVFAPCVSHVECNQDEELFPTVVQTLNGPVQGVVGKSRNESKPYVAFTGLRYANPPQRFEPPQPLKEKWTTPKIFNKPGNFCPQLGETGDWHEVEDCLFLNVYVPKAHLENGQGSLPVLFFIHGGGFAFGDGFNYRPDYFMENEDVILITINYRLGALGFLTMEDDTLPGNNGLRDQVMALQWVKDNIAAFKGDPDNVLIFGNSAGSASVHYLLMSPLAKGLFHKAIMQSGAFSFWSYSPNPKETHLNCSMAPDGESASEQIRKCLEGKSVKEILQAQLEFNPRWPGANIISRFLPTAQESKSSNPFFSSSPKSFFTPGTDKTYYASKVPIITGSTRSEGSTLFAACVLSDAKSIEDLNSKWNQLAPQTFCYDSFYPATSLPDISEKVRKFYFGQAQQITPEHSTEMLSVVYSDALFTLPVMAAAKQMAEQGMSVWPYQFSFVGRWSLRSALKLMKLPGMVGHGDELQYLFPHEMLGPPLEEGSIEEKFSRLFVKFWIYFAKNGEPAQEFVVEGEPLEWHPINKTSARMIDDLQVLRILTKPKVAKLEFSDRQQFWHNLAEVASTGKISSNKTEL